MEILQVLQSDLYWEIEIIRKEATWEYVRLLKLLVSDGTSANSVNKQTVTALSLTELAGYKNIFS